MFSLWKIKQEQKNIAKNKKPSPKCKRKIPDKFFLLFKFFFLKFFIEKTSLLIFRREQIKKVSAGMTVEAAIVLPLFLFFFVNLGSAMEMIRLHQSLQMGLWDVGNQLCVYSYAVSKDGESAETGVLEAAGDIALTYTYVKNQIVNYCGENYLNASPLSRGTDGLQFWESQVVSHKPDTASGVVDIILTYQVSPWLDIPYVKPFRMSNRYYGKMWTGFELNEGGSGVYDQDMVYVTENREVYHESLECTHLKLSICTIGEQELSSARNLYGRRYTLCSKCGRKGLEEGGEIFVCREGDYYHYKRNCPGLTRIISAITRQQATEEKLRPCSRCAGK